MSKHRNPRPKVPKPLTPDNPDPSSLVARLYGDLVELEGPRRHCRRVRHVAAGAPNGQAQANPKAPLRARRRDRRAGQRGAGTERGHALPVVGSQRRKALPEATGTLRRQHAPADRLLVMAVPASLLYLVIGHLERGVHDTEQTVRHIAHLVTVHALLAVKARRKSSQSL